MKVQEEPFTKGANAFACLLLFHLFPELRSDIRLASHNLHAEPGSRDHFQVALVGAAHGMISAVNCT